MNAYSIDLRQRIFNYNLTHSVRQTAEVFHVSPNTVQCLKKLYCETGDLAPRPCNAVHEHAVSPEGEMYLQVLLKEQPDMPLQQLCENYQLVYGMTVGVTTMHNLLKRLGFSRKKKTFYDPKKYIEENEVKKDNYINELKNIDPEDCVFLDETGSCLDANLSHGRSPLGQRAYDSNPSGQGERISTVAVLTGNGIEAEYVYKGTMKAKWFVAYLEIYLLDILAKGKTLIMDNLPAHRAKKVKLFLDSHNISYLFIPPYSPEFNPIEEAFSKMKQFIRRQKPRTPEALEEAIRGAIKTVTADDAISYINHSYQFV